MAGNNDLTDANQIFSMEGLQSTELSLLSSQEMKDTEGALAPWLIGGLGGGAFGGGGYALGWYNGNYSWNTRRFLGNVGTGALAGATFGGAGALAGGGFFSAGTNIWRANNFGFNFGVNKIWRR
jgi:hypothetical protein